MHRPSPVIASLAAVLVLAACGGGDSDDASSDSESSDSASSADPSASATAEGDDRPDSDRPGRSDRPDGSNEDSESTDDGSGDDADGNTAELGRKDLRSALLTRSAMPARWSEVPTDGDGSGGICDIDIPELLGVPERSLRKADVKYALNEDFGPGVIESIGLVPSGRGPELLDGIRAGFGDCEDEVGGAPVTVSELDFPTLGEDSAAYEIHVGDEGESIDIPLVYAITGDVVIGLYAIDVASDPVALLEEYAPQAVDKAVRVLS